jgi:hypothetical protein
MLISLVRRCFTKELPTREELLEENKKLKREVDVLTLSLKTSRACRYEESRVREGLVIKEASLREKQISAIKTLSFAYDNLVSATVEHHCPHCASEICSVKTAIARAIQKLGK